MREPLFLATGLSRRFRLGSAVVQALDDVSLAIGRGQTLVIVGESGSGKSTFANMVMGSDKPDAGAMLFDAAPLPALRSKTLRRRIALVQQNPFGALNPRRSIGSAIALPLEVHGLGDAAARRHRVEELLGLVGLPLGFATRRPASLSGGQRQRVAIARALATDPELLVLDEPTSALDVSVQAHVLRLLKDLQARLGLTYVFITHDLAVARAMADRIAVLYRGRVVEEGPAEAIFAAPRHRYTALLLASIPTVTAEDDALKPDWPWATAPQGHGVAEDGCAFRPRCPFAIANCAGDRPPLAPASPTHFHACLSPAGGFSRPDVGA